MQGAVPRPARSAQLPGSAREDAGDAVDAERWAGHQREHVIRHEAYAAEVASVRAYFDAVLAERDRRLEVEREMLANSVNQRAAEMERRLAGLNDLRSEVLADRAQFVTRTAFEPVAARQESFLDRDFYHEQAKALADKLDVNVAAIAELRREISNQRSRAAGYAAAVGIAVVVMTAMILLVQFTRAH